jgi:hypothetical protein
VSEPIEPKRATKTESSGYGDGPPPRKTAVGYGGSDDDDHDDDWNKLRKEQKEEQQQMSRMRKAARDRGMLEETEDKEFARRWRLKYPQPAGSQYV